MMILNCSRWSARYQIMYIIKKPTLDRYSFPIYRQRIFKSSDSSTLNITSHLFLNQYLYTCRLTNLKKMEIVKTLQHNLWTALVIVSMLVSLFCTVFLIAWMKCRNVPRQMKYIIINMIVKCCFSGPIHIAFTLPSVGCTLKIFHWTFIVSMTELTIILLLLDQFLFIFYPFWYTRCSTWRLRVITVLSVFTWPCTTLTIAGVVIDSWRSNTTNCVEMFYQLKLKVFLLAMSTTYLTLVFLFSVLVWRKLRQCAVIPLSHLSRGRKVALTNVLIITTFMSLFEMLVFVAAIILETLDVNSGEFILLICVRARGIGDIVIYGIFLPSLLMYKFKESRVQFVIIFCHCLPSMRIEAKRTRTHLYMEAAGIPLPVSNGQDLENNNVGIIQHVQTLVQPEAVKTTLR